MDRPSLKQTIAQVISENELPDSLKMLSMEDLIEIVELCQEHRFKKGDRSEFSKKFEQKLETIFNR